MCCSNVCDAQVISIYLVLKNEVCYFLKHHVEYVIFCKMSQTDPPTAGPPQQYHYNRVMEMAKQEWLLSTDGVVTALRYDIKEKGFVAKIEYQKKKYHIHS